MYKNGRLFNKPEFNEVSHKVFNGTHHLERLSAHAARWRTEGLIRIISAPHERVLQMGDFFAAAAGFIGGGFKQ